MASTAISKDVITVIAQEMSCAVDRSVEYWMAQLDEALTDTRLTTLGQAQCGISDSREIQAAYGQVPVAVAPTWRSYLGVSG